MLDRKNIRIKRSMAKFDHKRFGPFVVKRKIGTQPYDQELPPRWPIHLVFNVGFLEPYRKDSIGRQVGRVPKLVVNTATSSVIYKVFDIGWYGGVMVKFPSSVCTILSSMGRVGFRGQLIGTIRDAGRYNWQSTTLFP